MKHLGISGGGTKICGLFGAAEVIMKEKNFMPDVISGISAGAILSLPLALGKWDVVKKLVLKFTLDDFFSSSPITSRGGISPRGALRALFGKPYLGRQDNLIKKLKSIVSKEEFENYKTNASLPACIIGAVDFKSGSRKYINLKTVTYEEFPVLVNASSSLPVFTNGIEMQLGGKPVYLYDGGVRDHIATFWILGDEDSEFKDKIKETVSIYSRPEKFVTLPDDFDDKSILTILQRYIDITNMEVSKNDEYQEDKFCRDNNIIQHKCFLPRVMDSVYDTNPEHIKAMYEAGRVEAGKLNIGGGAIA